MADRAIQQGCILKNLLSCTFQAVGVTDLKVGSFVNRMMCSESGPQIQQKSQNQFSQYSDIYNNNI